jgi:hypothetical protein
MAPCPGERTLAQATVCNSSRVLTASSLEEVEHLSRLVHDSWIDASSARWSYRKRLWEVALQPFEPDARGGMKAPSSYSHVLMVRDAIGARRWGNHVTDSINEIDCSSRFVTIECHIDCLFRIEVESIDLELRIAEKPREAARS